MRNLLLASALAPALTLGLCAQTNDGSYWNVTTLPPNLVSVRVLGSLAAAQTTTDVHFFSGMTRQWAAVPISSAATVTITNTFGLVRDGNAISAWSTVDGSVSTLTVSPAATLQVGMASNSWVALVVDGAMAYAFSGFFTDWVQLTTSSTFDTPKLGAHVILLTDATDAYAFSAFHGQWVGTPLPSGVATSSASWFAAALTTASTVTAYSAYRNTWNQTSFANAATATAFHGDGYSTFLSGSEVLGFSTLTGNFAQYQAVATPTLTNGPNIAMISDNGTPVGYAPGVDRFVPLLPPASGGLRVASNVLGCYAIVDDGVLLQSFHAITGSVQYWVSQPTWSFRIGDTCAVAYDPGTGDGVAYSAMLDRWVVITNPQPVVAATSTLNAIVLQRANDWLAFSARTGTFTAVANNTGALVAAGVNALAALRDGDRIVALDSRFGEWATQLTGPAPVLSIFRHTGVAHDGASAYGFSLQHGTWETVGIQGGAVQTCRADAALALVQTATHLHLFTGTGSLGHLARVPEFIRSAVRGTGCHLLQNAAPGAIVFRAYAMELARTPIPGWGTLLLDPSSVFGSSFAVVPASGVLRTVLPIPDSPAFALFGMHVQDLVWPQSGAPFLTNAIAPIFY